MSDVEQAVKQRKAQLLERDAYARPELKVFGPVGVLTQAGSGNPGEMGGGMPPMMGMAMGMAMEAMRL